MEWNEWKKQTIELAINDITIKQEDKSQPLNFKFIKEGNKQIFQNNWANIVVTKSNGTDQTTTLSKTQVVAIQNNDIKVFANIDTFTKAIQTKDVSQTFAIADKDTWVSQDVKDQETVSLLSLLTTTTAIRENTQEVTKEITSVLGDEKKILDISQDEQVNNNLYPDFYAPELKELKSAFLAGDENIFNSVYAKLEKRIQIVYQNFDMNYTKTSWEPKARIESLISAIKKLREVITNEYNVPPKYNENLQSIGKSLNDLIDQTYGSEAPKEISTEEKIQE